MSCSRSPAQEVPREQGVSGCSELCDRSADRSHAQRKDRSVSHWGVSWQHHGYDRVRGDLTSLAQAGKGMRQARGCGGSQVSNPRTATGLVWRLWRSRARTGEERRDHREAVMVIQAFLASRLLAPHKCSLSQWVPLVVHPSWWRLYKDTRSPVQIRHLGIGQEKSINIYLITSFPLPRRKRLFSQGWLSPMSSQSCLDLLKELLLHKTACSTAPLVLALGSYLPSPLTEKRKLFALSAFVSHVTNYLQRERGDLAQSNRVLFFLF